MGRDPVKSEGCTLSHYSELTTFSGERTAVTVPCTYRLASMQCGLFSVQVITNLLSCREHAFFLRSVVLGVLESGK